MILKTGILASLIFIACGTAIAQNDTTLSLSLQEAQEYAINNNTDVQNSKLDIAAAKKQIWETTAIGLPHADATLDYQHLPGDLPTIQFDPNMPPIKLGVKNSSTYSVTVSQLIFSGEYIVGLQASRTFLELSKNSNEKTEIDTKESVIQSYYTILALERNKTYLDSSLKNIEEITAETKAFVDNGFMEQTDYEQMQITYNTIENSSKAIERQIEISHKLFKILLGLNLEDEVLLTNNLDEILANLDESELLNPSFDINNNIDYRMLETQEKINELSLRREKSKFLPSVSGFYLYQDKTNKADFDITFNHILGINVSLPIFSSWQKGAVVQQAKIELDKTKNTKAQMAKNLTMNFDQAQINFSNAYDKFKTEEMNIELSKKIYEQTSIKYKQGMSSSLDLNQANNQYIESLTNYTNALLDLLNAKTQLDKIQNKL